MSVESHALFLGGPLQGEVRRVPAMFQYYPYKDEDTHTGYMYERQELEWGESGRKLVVATWPKMDEDQIIEALLLTVNTDTLREVKEEEKKPLRRKLRLDL